MILLYNFVFYILLIVVVNFRWDKGGGGEILFVLVNLLRMEIGLNKVMNVGGIKVKWEVWSFNW